MGVAGRLVGSWKTERRKERELAKAENSVREKTRGEEKENKLL